MEKKRMGKMSERLLGGVMALAIASVCEAQPTGSGTTLFHGFTLVDPASATRTPDSWLVVEGDSIAAVGNGTAPEGEFGAVHDVTGLFAMPGLIDAHGHITAGPQRITLEDGAPRIEITSGDDYSRSNAAIALASGVTTVRNPGGSTAANARYDAMLASGAWTGPEAVHAGEVIQPPPFVGESFAYPRTPEEWQTEAARQAEAGMTYFKLYTDLTEDELALGVAAARSHGLTPIAHLNAVSWTRAVELGIEQLEHALPTSPALLEPAVREKHVLGADFMILWFELADYDGPLMQEMIRTLVAAEVEVGLTLQVNELVYHADRLESIFPELGADIPDYIHPHQVASLERNYAALAGVPAEQLARGRAIWPKVLELALVLHEAGVRLMIGTDGTGGGPTYAHELYNHVRAGISPWEVLRMATSGNAALMGVSDTGRIAGGYEADIVFLRADPTANVENTRLVELVVSNGVVHRPEDLLGIAREIAAAARSRAAE